MDKLTSGKIAPKTGEYNIVSSKGKVVGSVRVKKGNRMPPTRHANSHFEIDLIGVYTLFRLSDCHLPTDPAYLIIARRAGSRLFHAL